MFEQEIYQESYQQLLMLAAARYVSGQEKIDLVKSYRLIYLFSRNFTTQEAAVVLQMQVLALSSQTEEIKKAYERYLKRLKQDFGDQAEPCTRVTDVYLSLITKPEFSELCPYCGHGT